jgi:hypothetical protein
MSAFSSARLELDRIAPRATRRVDALADGCLDAAHRSPRATLTRSPIAASTPRG